MVNKPPPEVIHCESHGINMTRSMKDEQYDQFVSLFARYERSVRGFVRSLLPLLQDVDDVMQEVGLVCWRKFDSFTANDSSEDFVKWACVIARFEVLRHRRNCARDRLVLSEDVIEALAVDAEARVKTLQAERIAVEYCLKKLPDSERRLLLSVHTPGDSIARLATEIGQNARRLYSKINVLRDQISECVRQRLTEGEV